MNDILFNHEWNGTNSLGLGVQKQSVKFLWALLLLFRLLDSITKWERYGPSSPPPSPTKSLKKFWTKHTSPLNTILGTSYQRPVQICETCRAFVPLPKCMSPKTNHSFQKIIHNISTDQIWWYGFLWVQSLLYILSKFTHTHDQTSWLNFIHLVEKFQKHDFNKPSIWLLVITYSNGDERSHVLVGSLMIELVCTSWVFRFLGMFTLS